jgi:asparaginyl-tRNA synthetase
MLIAEIYSLAPAGQTLVAEGWVRTKRILKTEAFLELNDGSTQNNLQCTVELGDGGTELARTVERITTGAALRICGALVESPAAGQRVELRVTGIEIIGAASGETYPLQKKGHSFEFLRSISHLRARTNSFAAVFRIRSRMSLATHNFFSARNFFYVHTPLITQGDAEGAGSTFTVTTLDIEEQVKHGKFTGYEKDFFGKKTSLTVSGQLEAEALALALGRVYTFGPTFRAENSNTTRHLAEFWMIECEAAFFHLCDLQQLAEDFLKYVIGDALDSCAAELEFCEARIEKGLTAKLQALIAKPFTRITYTEAINILEKAASRGTVFEYRPQWGADLQSEHEKYLTENEARGPVIVTDYPRDIKAFYMKANDSADDRATVAAMDVLFPKVGEIIGGSEREADLAKLTARMGTLGMNVADYEWYLDLRRYGSVPHSGFGLGLERLVQLVTGMNNIRDVIPFPRAAGLVDF